MYSYSSTENMISLYQSINNDDYNVFLPTIIALPLKLFGYTFPRYVLLCFILFAIPTFLVQGFLAVKLCAKAHKTDIAAVYAVAVILAGLFAQNYYAMLKGYIDIAYLLPMSVAMLLFVDYDFGRISFRTNLAIVCMLILTWICRRYTIFFLIGYAAAMLFKAVIAIKQKKNITKSAIINLLEMGLMGASILLIFFRKFFLHALLTNYGAMYSAYDASLENKLRGLIENFGADSLLFLVLVGVFCLLMKSKGDYVPLLIMLIVETAVFWQTQDMGVQHYMILNVPVFAICMMVFDGCSVTAENCKKIVGGGYPVYARCAAAVFCVLVIGVNFVKAFDSRISVGGCGTFFAQRYYPLQRNDMDAIDSLADRLNELTAETDDHIYVVASGSILNCDILRKADMPYTDNAVPACYDTSDVDLRDGFPTDFLHAKYVVTTDPIQLHLSSGQEVVSYLAAGVQNESSYIGEHFCYLEQYQLDDGVTAKIYEKTSEFGESDLQKLRDYYTALYPDSGSIFADRIT